MPLFNKIYCKVVVSSIYARFSALLTIYPQLPFKIQIHLTYVNTIMFLTDRRHRFSIEFVFSIYILRIVRTKDTDGVFIVFLFLIMNIIKT